MDSIKPSINLFRSRSEIDGSDAIFALGSHPSTPSEEGIRGENHIGAFAHESSVRVTLDVSLLRSIDGEKVSSIMKGIRTLRELGAEVVVLYRSPKEPELLKLRKLIQASESAPGHERPQLSILKSPSIDARSRRADR